MIRYKKHVCFFTSGRFSTNVINVQPDILGYLTYIQYTVCLKVKSIFLSLQEPVQFSSVQLLSHVWLFVTPWTAAHEASLSITNSRSLLKLMSIESVMPSNHLIFTHPFLLPPSIFSSESVLCIRWPKYCSFSISTSNEHPGLISLRMD